MKTILNSFATAILLLQLTACGDQKSGTPETDNKSGQPAKDSALQKASAAGNDMEKGGAPAQITSCVTFAGEDVIKIEPSIISAAAAQAERTRFDDNIACVYNSDTVPLFNVPVIIKISEILRLYQLIENTQADIRGVQIHLSLSGKNIIPFFNPVTLRCVDSSTLPGEYSYNVIHYQVLYKYNTATDQFDVADAAEFARVTTNYVNDIRLKHTDTDTEFTSMYQNAADGDKRDTKSLFFSFQELFRLIYGQDGCVGTPNHSGYLYFYNGGARLNIGGVYTNKHTMLVTLEEFTAKTKLKKQFALVAEAANLAHLCPPNCVLKYEILTKYPCTP
jgi:hypothetical protein